MHLPFWKEMTYSCLLVAWHTGLENMNVDKTKIWSRDWADSTLQSKTVSKEMPKIQPPYIFPAAINWPNNLWKWCPYVQWHEWQFALVSIGSLLYINYTLTMFQGPIVKPHSLISSLSQPKDHFELCGPMYFTSCILITLLTLHTARHQRVIVLPTTYISLMTTPSIN